MFLSSRRTRNAAFRRAVELQRGLAVLASMFILACGDVADGTELSDSEMDANPLPLVAQSDWQSAQHNCEGMMSGAVEFGVADGEPDLLVAIGSRGVVCVDTFLVFENELGADSLAMERIWLRYMATLQELGPELAGDQRDASLR